jgi:hypothetical protein
MVTGHPTSHIAAGTVASFRIWRGSRSSVVRDPALKNVTAVLLAAVKVAFHIGVRYPRKQETLACVIFAKAAW